MGSAPAHHLGTIIMKFLLLIAAIASVRAEADPAFSYATGYHLPYAYGAPLTYTAAAAPVVTYAHAPVVYTAAAGSRSRGRCLVFLPHSRLLAPWLRPPCLQLCSLRIRRSLRLLRAWPSLRLLRQVEEGGDR